MEDASAVDLDWFWRGWFYTNDHVDISLDKVNWFKISTGNPDIENPIAKVKKDNTNTFIGNTRNKSSINKTVTESNHKAVDFYTTYDPFLTDTLDREDYSKYLKNLSEDEKEILKSDKNYYEIHFSNIGGIVMPIILEFQYTDATSEIIRIPAEIWKRNSQQIKKIFILDKELNNVVLDPFSETADVDISNNHWPARVEATRFQLFKQRKNNKDNPMQRDIKAKEIIDIK
jgi:hypothetical protein